MTAIVAARYVDGNSGDVIVTYDDGVGRFCDAALAATLPELAAYLAGGGEIKAGGVNLFAYAADKRWQREVAGIALGGIPIATDDRSKLMIMGARLAAQSDPEWSTIWIGADGDAYPINGATIVMISDAVAAHVNACFATFANVKSAIEAETITTTAEIDAEFAA